MRKTDARCDHTPVPPLIRLPDEKKNALRSSDSMNPSLATFRRIRYRHTAPVSRTRNSVTVCA